MGRLLATILQKRFIFCPRHSIDWHKINPPLLQYHAPSRLLQEVVIYNQAECVSDEINWDWDFGLNL